MIPPRRAAIYRFLYIGTVLSISGLSACFFTRTPAPDSKVRPQEWRESRGPVVPHDNFPADCTLCHAKGSWHEIRKDMVFDHEKETGVPMRGAHAQAQCLRCHNDRGAVALFAKQGCSGCHQDIHRGRLGIKCTTCHSEDNWNPTGIYALHAQTRFPLTSVHVGVACFRCHPAAESGQFIGADPRCEACHRSDAVQAKSFDHVAGGKLTNCQQCHSQSTWSGANPHVGNFSDCIRCHQSTFDAQNQKDPGHAANGTNCGACHNTQSWAGASHNHIFNQFHHNNGTCTNCHTPPKYATFSCFLGGCHPKGETDSHHEPQNAPGYVYASQNCYQCHMNGNAPKPKKPQPVLVAPVKLKKK